MAKYHVLLHLNLEKKHAMKWVKFLNMRNPMKNHVPTLKSQIFRVKPTDRIFGVGKGDSRWDVHGRVEIEPVELPLILKADYWAHETKWKSTHFDQERGNLGIKYFPFVALEKKKDWIIQNDRPTKKYFFYK